MEKVLGKEILGLVGGAENLNAVTHCATRLRLQVKNKGNIDSATLSALPGVLSVQDTAGQLQVVIGTTVGEVYDDFVKGTPFAAGGAAPATEAAGSGSEGAQKRRVVTMLLDAVSAIFTPLLGLLAGSGVLRGLVLLAVNFGWLSDTSSTYTILYQTSNAVFYFLPILLAYTSAEHFKTNKFIAMAVMGTLITPSVIALMGDTGNGTVTSFFGLPIVLMDYTSTVFPAILTVWALSYLERWLTKVVTPNLRLLVVPLVSLVVMVPLAAGVIGPVGVGIGDVLALAINWLLTNVPLLGGILLGGLWNVFVMFGVHWGFVPVIIQNLGALGYDYILPLAAISNFGIAGAVLGFFFRTRDKKMKTFSVSALISVLIAGVTEVSIYGIAVKFRRIFISAIVGGAVGGAFAAAFHTTGIAVTFGALTTLPAFVGDTFWYYVIGITIAFVVSLVMTLVWGTGTARDEKVEGASDDGAHSPSAKPTVEVLTNPVSGEVADLAEASDQTFASGALGPGFVVRPSDDTLVSPVDGVVKSLFPTSHAIGLVSDDGAEILIHIGVDTVKLDGKHFDKFVAQGDRVRKGQPLLRFDRAAITAEGYDISTFVVVTNGAHYAETALMTAGLLDAGTEVFSVTTQGA